MITFLIGSFLMKDITSSTVEGMMYWPFGLFMSEHTLASIILGAIPTKMKTSKCNIYINSLCNSIFLNKKKIWMVEVYIKMHACTGSQTCLLLNPAAHFFDSILQRCFKCHKFKPRYRFSAGTTNV